MATEKRHIIVAKLNKQIVLNLTFRVRVLKTEWMDVNMEQNQVPVEWPVPNRKYVKFPVLGVNFTLGDRPS